MAGRGIECDRVDSRQVACVLVPFVVIFVHGIEQSYIFDLCFFVS